MLVLTPQNPQGFCFGVKRAVDMVIKFSNDSPIQVIGSLVHNPEVVSNLSSRGITTITSVSDVTTDIVAITAHGAPRNISDILSDKTVIDATCPFVKSFQNQVKELGKLGYKIIILGDCNHPEIISVSSFADSPIIVSNPEECRNIGRFKKIALVCQTTQNVNNLNSVAATLKNHTDNLLVENTICPSTKTRQKDAVSLAENVAVMVVVGGYMSANTRRLVSLVKKYGTETVWIEKPSDLSLSLLSNISDKISSSSLKAVGLISGASTPAKSVSEIEQILTEYSG